jgi:hypothetical protein
MRIALPALMVLLALRAESAALPQNQPGPEQIPEWAEQGRFRFARLDGGPIEILKTARSEWGKHFNEKEKEVLANLYTKYADRMIDRLLQAHINWVWITWSAGFSWADEEEQRQQCRRLIDRLHQKKIHVAAYVCATTIFWESMFRDEPRSVRWLSIDPEGLPYRYSGGRDTFRFIADVRNPEWVAYEKQRIGSAIDAGVDGFFIDNTSSPRWNSASAMDNFINEMRRYVRVDKRSDALLLSNYGLSPDRARLNRNMDVLFNEYWREPGVWGAEWDVSNLRRMRYMRGLIPEWKPMMSEYSNFHDGNRSTTFLSPRSARLAMAEAAAFRSSYTWNMEGPFYERLLANDSAAVATWQAIADYNGFFQEHEDLYRKAASVSPLAVVLPDDPRAGHAIGFSWNKEQSGLLDAMSKASVLYDIRLLKDTSDRELKQYRKVVTLDEASSSADLQRIREQVGGLSVTVEGAPNVIANVTCVQGTGRWVVHLLNYASTPATHLHIKLSLPNSQNQTARLFTPDAGTQGLSPLKQSGAAQEFTLGALDTYAVVTVGTP